MSANLTWGEAAALARSGAVIRREIWPLAGVAWLRRGPGALWDVLDADQKFLRVVRSADFESADFFAQDWTTEPPDASPDVCARAPKRSRFTPPGIGLVGEVGVSSISLVASIGASAPAGVFMVDFFLDGDLVGTLEAPSPGRYTVDAGFTPTEGETRAWIEVRSSLPLPQWVGRADWVRPAASFTRIDLGVELADFPGNYAPVGWMGPDVVLGPYAHDVWIYSHADDGALAAQADDDLAIGLGPLTEADIVFRNSQAGWVVPGGATALLLVVPAGQTWRVNVWNAGGYVWAHGKLRAYNRPV